MKKKLVILLCAALLLVFAGCRQTPLVLTPGIGSEGELYLQITGGDMEAGKLSVTWHNDTAYEAVFGAAYVIERLEDGQWVSCAVKDEISFIALAYILPAHSSREETYSLETPYKTDKPGQYRIRSDCYLQTGEEGKKYQLTAEFTLE